MSSTLPTTVPTVRNAPFIVGDPVEIRVAGVWHSGVVTDVLRHEPKAFGMTFTLAVTVADETTALAPCGEDYLGPHLRPAPPEL